MAAATDLKQITEKMKRYCAYQERCREEVLRKMDHFALDAADKASIISELIRERYLDELRFASSYASGKLQQKKWGKQKIAIALRQRKVASSVIETALHAISGTAWQAAFDSIANKIYNRFAQTKNIDSYTCRNKFWNQLRYRGWEPERIAQKYNELSGNK